MSSHGPVRAATSFLCSLLVVVPGSWPLIQGIKKKCKEIFKVIGNVYLKSEAFVQIRKTCTVKSDNSR